MPGRHFLQIPGPANIPDRVTQAMSRPLMNHRGIAFKDLSLGLFPKLKKIFKTERGTVIIFPSSGTGAWESSLVNTLSPGDAVLAFSIGEFSAGYARCAKNNGFAVDLVELPWGSSVSEALVYEKLKADAGHKYKAVLTIHNETATGVATDIAAVREALNKAKHPALLLVDTISGLASIDFRFDAWGVDVATACSQKGLLMPAGLGILCASEKALKARESAKSPRHYFDWGPMMSRNAEGYFPYTPATTLLYGLDEATDLLLDEGLEHVFARHARMADGVRTAVRAWGFKVLAERPEVESNVITTVMLPPGVDSDALLVLSETEFDLSLGAGLGPLKGKAFRIGHLGHMNDLEVLATLAGVEMALSRLGAKISLGAGVAACQKRFLDHPMPKKN
ncbi:MAG: aminotransferase class V-fold PLP-dependent enzyme [Deltaproteobacteria bacterium]|nr:aminotransferase class V-fold PLP-dependent enzyme [Deltaproteobacteria bacterium]